MNDEIPALDLLGDPLRDMPDPRGRPKHRVTKETRNEVSVLRAASTSRDEIAAVLGVSRPTLEKYYFSELNEGVSRERARAIGWLRASAEGGNVSAQKAYLALIEAGRAVVPVAERADAESELGAGLGKKERAKIDARNADKGSAWGDLVKH